MLGEDVPDKVVGIPYNIDNSDLSWIEKINHSTYISARGLFFSDTMNESHRIDLKEIHKQIWRERLLEDIDAMIEYIKTKEV